MCSLPYYLTSLGLCCLSLFIHSGFIYEKISVIGEQSLPPWIQIPPLPLKGRVASLGLSFLICTLRNNNSIVLASEDREFHSAKHKAAGVPGAPAPSEGSSGVGSRAFLLLLLRLCPPSRPAFWLPAIGWSPVTIALGLTQPRQLTLQPRPGSEHPPRGTSSLRYPRASLQIGEGGL